MLKNINSMSRRQISVWYASLARASRRTGVVRRVHPQTGLRTPTNVQKLDFYPHKCPNVPLWTNSSFRNLGLKYRVD